MMVLSDWVFIFSSVAGGALLTALVCWVVFNMKLKQQNALAQLTQEHLETSNAQLKTELTNQVATLESMQDQLRLENTELALSNATLQTRLEEQLKTEADQASQFEQLSKTVLQALQTDMETRQEKTDIKRQATMQATMEERLGLVVKPLKDIILAHEKQVKALEKQQISDTAGLKNHIELLVSQTAQLVQVKDRLAEALSNSKGRGDWGELALTRLLEMSGLQPGVHFEAQKIQNSLRPDITLFLPNERVIYIDAKTILVNLEQLLLADDSNNTEAAQKARKKHADALEKEILSLNVKGYAALHKNSIDFVVLYVPRESMLRVALEEKPLLMEAAFQRKVLLASPLVLMAILKTVAYGWDQAKLSQNAQEIQALGEELHRRAALFLSKFEKLGERLEQVGHQYEETETTLTGRRGIVAQLKKFEKLGCKSEKSLPEKLSDKLETQEQNDTVHV
ncbi:MAG: DNA recombination protein RmuC [Cyanobacteria bacterium P01_H01_bin.74]